jgi:hypothetical protein
VPVLNRTTLPCSAADRHDLETAATVVGGAGAVAELAGP